MPVKTVLVLLLMVITAALGDITLKRGMDQVGAVEARSLADAWYTGVRFFSNGTVWAGIALLGLYFFSFAVALSWADVSLVVPCSAGSFVLTAALARWHLGEAVGASRWVGTLLIVIGVLLVVRKG